MHFPKPAVQQWPHHFSTAYVGDADIELPVAALKERSLGARMMLLDGLIRPTPGVSATTVTARGERTLGQQAVSGDLAVKLQATWAMSVQEWPLAWPASNPDFAVPCETAQARSVWHLEHTHPSISEDDMIKLSLLVSAALVTGAVVFDAPHAPAKVSACDVDSRGEAIVWANQNPGVRHTAACHGPSGN